MTRFAPASRRIRPSSAVLRPPPTWHGRRFAIISMRLRFSPWRIAASRSISWTIGYFEKRSIQYSKSSKASFSFSPWTSWTMRPPMRSIEGISILLPVFLGGYPPLLPGDKFLLFRYLRVMIPCKFVQIKELSLNLGKQRGYGLLGLRVHFRFSTVLSIANWG